MLTTLVILLPQPGRSLTRAGEGEQVACQFILETRNLIDSGESASGHLDLTGNPTAARDARGFIRSELRGLMSLDKLDDVLLLTSELVANVVLHASTDMHLGVAWDSSSVLVAVQDHSPAPAAGAPTAPIEDLEESGRGMAIIAALADDFGWRRLPEATGKVMWFVVAFAEEAASIATEV